MSQAHNQPEKLIKNPWFFSLAISIFLVSSLQAMEPQEKKEESLTLSAEYLQEIQQQLNIEEGSDLVSIYKEETADICFPEEGKI